MMRIKIPTRLKPLNNGKDHMAVSSEPSPIQTISNMQRDKSSPLIKATHSLVLKVVVIKARNLAAKDWNGLSDPYLVVSLGDYKIETHSISKTLNPEWNMTMQMPIQGPNSLVLHCVCWDKDRLGKDYMGEFELVLEDIFSGELTELEPRWFPLQNEWHRKKGEIVSGDVQLQFTLFDTSDLSAPPGRVLEKFRMIVGSFDLSDGSSSSKRQEKGETQFIDEGDIEPSDDTDDASRSETAEKQRRGSRFIGIRCKKSMNGYEFSSSGEVMGIVYLEICKVNDLPPERNVTRTSFDMDPFVVVSLGKKTLRTRYIRHNLNPIFEEKMILKVLKNEQAYSFSFTVVDHDKLSGNDFVASCLLPLREIMETAPEANPVTGLYALNRPDISIPQSIKSRFRLPLSRSVSMQDLSKLNSQSSPQNALLARSTTSSTFLNPVTPTTPKFSLADNMSVQSSTEESNIDPHLREFMIPLKLKNAEKWAEKHNPQLYVKAKYVPYPALRQQFWRSMLRQYDSDEVSRISRVGLTTMLDTLGSTLKESTIDSWFKRFPHQSNGDESNSDLTFDEAVICLEDQLMNNPTSSSFTDRIRSMMPIQSPAEDEPYDRDDLNDKEEEHVVEIRECPTCHQPRLNKRSDADIVTHIATCASQDWQNVNNFVMGGFVTSSQAQRKWYSKVITKISYGGYQIGANSANILVQDRITGQVNEERMSVYVRLGIRLLYKGLKSKDMEKKRIRKLLRSLSQKQGTKYDDPASRAVIQKFIAFHQLDLSEVLVPLEGFKNFNEFFYRQLKPTARTCSAPDNPGVVVSPADCRCVVFNRIDIATRIWVKGREFTIERLLGHAYPEDAPKFKNGALGIFRLAPQDYHRFHIPVDGVMGEPKTIEGEYYTVNPMAVRSALDVYGENVRVVIPIDSEAHGRVMVICVGAMMVGSTVITRENGERVKRAEELGYFKFGGSTILLLFEKGTMKFDEDLVENSNIALETLIRVGMSIGHIPSQLGHTSDMRKQDQRITQKELEDASRRIECSFDDDCNVQKIRGKSQS